MDISVFAFPYFWLIRHQWPLISFPQNLLLRKINFSFPLPWYHIFLVFLLLAIPSQSPLLVLFLPFSFSDVTEGSPFGPFLLSSDSFSVWLYLIPRCNYEPNAVNFQISSFTQISLEPSTFISNCLKDIPRRTSYTHILNMSKIHHFPKPLLSFFQKPCSCHVTKTINSITIYSGSQASKLEIILLPHPSHPINHPILSILSLLNLSNLSLFPSTFFPTATALGQSSPLHAKIPMWVF